MNSHPLLAALFLGLIGASCSRPPPTTPDDPQALERRTTIAAERAAQQRLQENLQPLQQAVANLESYAMDLESALQRISAETWGQSAPFAIHIASAQHSLGNLRHELEFIRRSIQNPGNRSPNQPPSP
jgi:uncharacterized protein (DUF3084 family)